MSSVVEVLGLCFFFNTFLMTFLRTTRTIFLVRLGEADEASLLLLLLSTGQAVLSLFVFLTPGEDDGVVAAVSFVRFRTLPGVSVTTNLKGVVVFFGDAISTDMGATRRRCTPEADDEHEEALPADEQLDVDKVLVNLIERRFVVAAGAIASLGMTTSCGCRIMGQCGVKYGKMASREPAVCCRCCRFCCGENSLEWAQENVFRCFVLLLNADERLTRCCFVGVPKHNKRRSTFIHGSQSNN